MAASAGDKPVTPGHSGSPHTQTTLHARGCTLPTAYRGPQVNTLK